MKTPYHHNIVKPSKGLVYYSIDVVQGELACTVNGREFDFNDEKSTA